MRQDLLPMRTQRYAEERPNECVLSFLDAQLRVADSLTYRELDHRARAIGAVLLERGLSGAQVVLSYPAGLDFATAFCGCLYAGAVAVPAPLPRRSRADQRMAGILADSDARCILTDAEHTAELGQQASAAAGTIDVVATDMIAPLPDGGETGLDADRLAFLQYTSGSTRSPLGVMVRHGDLAANLDSLREVLAPDRESVGVSWLPSFHDMGLIAGLLLPVWLGYPAFLMAPTTFIKNPMSWLQSISRHRGTHSGGPNFAYQACIDAVCDTQLDGLDLSSWKVAWNGAEPIRPETVDLFRARFAATGFRPQSIAPGYGLAEATLVVSGSDGTNHAVELAVDESELRVGQVRPRDPGDPGVKRLSGSGRPPSGVEVRIVRPDARRVIDENSLGEIWVRSSSVAQGYWCKPQDTAEFFDAYLATGEGPYLRTGDLGFLRDGELFVIGRLKDTIVIRGVNYFPHDVEGCVDHSHPALQRDAGAVFDDEASGRTSVVAVQEIRRDALGAIDPDEAVEAIRRAVAREHQLALQRVVLLLPGGIPKTSSGKIQRSLCRDKLHRKELPILTDWRMPEPGRVSVDIGMESLSQPGILERQLVEWLQKELALSDLTWRSPLTDMGIDSLKGVELANALSTAFDHSFPATSILDHPTVASLATLIRRVKLGADTDLRDRTDGCYTAEQIDALDADELAKVLQERVDTVLDGGGA
ncbi:AMP-binding protein [Mycobacterium sp. Y57]|nr:AMP-binding protein [Mycolicibacterium xanthum]